MCLCSAGCYENTYHFFEIDQMLGVLILSVHSINDITNNAHIFNTNS